MIRSVATHTDDRRLQHLTRRLEAELNRIEPLDLPALREYIQEHPGCDWEDACDWYEQITGRTVPEEQYGEIEAVWQEESQEWEPTDDEMMGAFGTPWHDGL